ncbi:MAG: DUF4190 domain-containing protein [Candidatus Nanopelagicales bacterium]
MSEPSQPALPDPDQPGSTPPGSYPPSAYPPAVPDSSGAAQPPAAPDYYGPGYATPAQYGQSQYTPVVAPTQSNDAVVALVLSIASWLFCPIVLAIVALVFAAKAKRAIAASNGWVTGEGMATAAKVISWINIALVLVGLIAFVVVLVVLAATSSSTTYG